MLRFRRCKTPVRAVNFINPASKAPTDKIDLIIKKVLTNSIIFLPGAEGKTNHQKTNKLWLVERIIRNDKKVQSLDATLLGARSRSYGMYKRKGKLRIGFRPQQRPFSGSR